MMTPWILLVMLASFVVVSAPVVPPDWKAFADPKAFLLTDTFADSIKALTPEEKAMAIRRLQESLLSSEVEIRRRAALTLDRLGDRSGVPTLIADLATAKGHDRNNVLVALRIMKDERAIPALREALKDPSPYVRSIAAAALGELKASKAFADLVELTRDKGMPAEGKKADGGLDCIPICPATSACYALGGLGDNRAVPILIALLGDADCKVSARQALEVLTQNKLGNDPEHWKAWWKEQGR